MRASELLTLLRARRDDDAIPAATLLGYANQAQLDLCSRKDWTWLRREHSFSSSGTTTLSITFTSGSRTATLAAAHVGTFFGASLYAPTPTGRFFRLVNIDSTRLVITLDRIWPDASGLRADVVLIRDEYALPYGASKVLYVEARDGTQVGHPLRHVSVSEAADQFHAGTGTPDRFSTYQRHDLPTPTRGPGLAVGGAGLTGTFLFWMSFYNQRTGWESPLSTSATITLANQGVNITPGAVREDFSWRVYRSIAGGSSPHFLDESPNMTTTFAAQNTPDEYLGPARPAAYSPTMLKLSPAPADSGLDFTAVVQVSPPQVLTTTDTVLVPDEHIVTLIDGAELYYLGGVQEDGRKGQIRADFEAGIRRMLRRDNPSAATFRLASQRSKRQGSVIRPISAVE